VRAARLGAGDRVVLGVRRQGDWQDVQIVAAGPSGDPLPLGLTLRRVTGLGSEVVNVDHSSAAAAAGIERGDLVTLVGTVAAPTPAQIEGAFQSAAKQGPVLIAIRRGATFTVATLQP
jgi:S1-C subfamily serine protease